MSGVCSGQAGTAIKERGLNRIVAGIVGVFVVAAIVIAAALFFILRDDADDEGAVSHAAVVAAPVVRADAVVMPVRSAYLSMPKSGVVSEVLVSENQLVGAGQALVRLDDADAVAAFRKAEAALDAAQADFEALQAVIAEEREIEDETRPGKLEQARLAEWQAEERYLHLSGANRAAGASVSVDGAALEAGLEKAIADAEAAVQQAQDAVLAAKGVASAPGIPQTPESAARIAERDAKVAAIRLTIFDLQAALDNADDEAELRSDAEEAVMVANALLLNAKRKLDVTRLQTAADARIMQDAYDDAALEWRMVHKRYLGIDLTGDELLQDPDTLFSDWGVDLEEMFDRDNQPLGAAGFIDDPATRWDELKIFAWLRLHPGPSAVLKTCEGVKLPRAIMCMEREYDDAWDALSAAREDLMAHELDAANSIAAAENAVVASEKAVRDADRALELVPDGRREVDAERIRSDIDAANAALTELLDFADPVEVAQAEANLEAAEANLEALLPDDAEIAAAEQVLADLRLQIEKLERGRDPLAEARREARLEAAESRIALAATNLDTAELALQDNELLAPFAGTVVALSAEAGEEVGARQPLMRLADISAWELHTADLDELSVVNLAEGSGVQVRFDALPDLELAGTVTRISRFGEEKQGAVTYTAEIRIDGSDPRLRWGMTASIRK